MSVFTASGLVILALLVINALVYISRKRHARPSDGSPGLTRQQLSTVDLASLGVTAVLLLASVSASTFLPDSWLGRETVQPLGKLGAAAWAMAIGVVLGVLLKLPSLTARRRSLPPL